ncbi:MAG: ABC transporter ATP-binding protein [Dehalococcoidia bacterium]
MKNALAVRGATLAYDRRIVSAGLEVELPEGAVTAIVGPNACGKSTLLRALSRLLTPSTGEVLVDGVVAGDLHRRVFAQRVGLLPQAPSAPMDVTVEELVAAGRSPYQRWYRQWSAEDEASVEAALLATNTDGLRDRPVDALSGGQRQRVWLAMALARRTPVMLLDEPTTYLDIAHQVEVLDLVRQLNRRERSTVVMVLHDLSQACRYADHVVVMKDGGVVATGHPSDVITQDLVRSVFGVEASVVVDQATGRPLVFPRGTVIPRSAHDAARTTARAPAETVAG